MDILTTIETDLFDHREVKPHFINRCCFGEDFADWLKREISPLADSGFSFSESIQQDYGWGFRAWRDSDQFWVALSYVGYGPQEEPAQWVITVVYDPGWNIFARLFHKSDAQALKQLRDQILRAVTSNPAIRIVPNPNYGA